MISNSNLFSSLPFFLDAWLFSLWHEAIITAVSEGCPGEGGSLLVMGEGCLLRRTLGSSFIEIPLGRRERAAPPVRLTLARDHDKLALS